MRKFLIAVLVASASLSSAGTVRIGVDTMNGGTKAGSCHIVSFIGTADRVALYKRTRADKFETVDPAVVSEMEKDESVVVVAAVVTDGQLYCARNSGIPQRIVITAKGSREPIFTIPLESQKVPLANAMGAEFTAYEASGKITKEDLSTLAKDLDFYLIYEGRESYKDKWRANYPSVILAPTKR